MTKITDNGVVDLRPMHVKSLKQEETAEMKWQVNEAAIKGCTAVCSIITINPDADSGKKFELLCRICALLNAWRN